MIFLDENGPPPSKRPHSEVVRKQVNVKNDGLKYDEDGYVVVYTDGACENNGKTNAKAGYGIFWGDNHPLNRSEPASRATNNAAEIEAVTETVKLGTIHKLRRLKLRICDSPSFHVVFYCLFYINVTLSLFHLH